MDKCFRQLFNQVTGQNRDRKKVRNKYSRLVGETRHRAVEREERRVADSMGEFLNYGRGTGGGSPLYPPEDTDDEDEDVNEANFIPISLPQHLQVMGPPSDVNLGITQGPSASQGSSASQSPNNGINQNNNLKPYAKIMTNNF